jgi:3-hydroxybutyryl-CoA dehydrogenase
MHVAVLGAGERGRTVAGLCALAGHEVHLQADDANRAMDAVDAVVADLPGGADASAVRDRLDATTGLEAAVADAGVVVETATDDAGSLQERFAAVESLVARETLLVTTADRLSVTAAAAGLRHPDRAVGFRLRQLDTAALVEVVVAEQTAAGSYERVREFVAGLDRQPVLVGDAPGGAGTRLALGLAAEAMRLVDEGVAGVAAVDETLVAGYDHPVGPLERADRAGLDARLESLEYLAAELGARFEPPAVLRDLVAEGHHGRPTGRGFYRWEGGEPVEPAVPDPGLPGRETAPDDPADT